MRLNIYTLATDDKNGTRADVFCSETERDDALLAWVNSDRAQWAGSKFADDLHEYVLSKIEFLDTFSTDEQEVEIDPAALMSVNTAWKLCKVAPGSFGNLYDPEEVTTILDGWGEEGDEDGTSHWFDPDRAEDHAAILAWCEAEGKQREQPHVWSPKNASATIHRDPEEQETFIVVKSAENDGDQDIQIKLRPDMIVLRRDFKDVWEGVKVDAFAVSVKVVNLSIRINHDGSINREDGDSTTWIEADGSVLKKTEFVDATMSGDGVELTRRTHLLSLGRQQCNLAGPLFPVFLKRARICKGAGFLIALKP